MRPPQGRAVNGPSVTSGAAGRSGRGEAQTHSPTVWGRPMPAQTLWLAGGSQECPSSLGGTLDRQGGLGRRACEGWPQEPPSKGPAGVAPGKRHSGRRTTGGQSIHLPALVGEGVQRSGYHRHTTRVTGRPGVPGTRDFQC